MERRRQHSFFKNYTTSGSSGIKWPLLAADKDNSTFNFYSNNAYTINGATTNVDCNIVITQPEDSIFAGDLPNISAESMVITSVRPKFNDWDVDNGAVELVPNSTNPIAFQFKGALGYLTDKSGRMSILKYQQVSQPLVVTSTPVHFVNLSLLTDTSIEL